MLVLLPLLQILGVSPAARISPELPPPCHVDSTKKTTHIGNAGCIVTSNHRILMTVHKPTGTWNLPGGTSEPGETAQCTAHRETWEETGFDVLVGSLLKQFDNGFYLYQCETKKSRVNISDPIPLPEWAKTEVTLIKWMDPTTIESKSYRFPKQLKFIQGLVSQTR